MLAITRNRVLIAVAAILSLTAPIGASGAVGSKAEHKELRLLTCDDGKFSELSFDLSAEELLAYFPEPVVRQLLEGKPLRLSSLAASAGIQNLVETPVGRSFDDIIGLYAVQQEADVTWACVKCCWAGTTCCCKVKDLDEIAGP